MDREILEVVVPEGIHADIIADFQHALRAWSTQSDWRFRTNPAISTPKLRDHVTAPSHLPPPTGAAESRFAQVQAMLTQEWLRAVRKANEPNSPLSETNE